MQSEYLDSLRMRLVMLPQSLLQSTGRLYRFVQCSPMPSEEGAMKIACFSFLVWSAHTGHFGYLFIFCIFQKLVLPCKPSNSLRSLVQNYKETIKENSSLSSCNFLSFSKMKKCSCSY